MAQQSSLEHSDHLPKGLYSSILPCHSWDHGENLKSAMHGGVFNFEFSPDGSLLVAACEKKSILMFDPHCRKLIHAVDNAHHDCVNCVRFLDSKIFATCSDDSTVALWDARNLKSQIQTLRGHSNWVKNIEFSSRDGLLVTSGFDGNVYTWDINRVSESGCVYNKVFHTNGLMGTRLNPDASKMIISTTGGYLMIVHNLDLNTLAQDLKGFKPSMYRLMQLSQTTIPLATEFTHLFSQQCKINRVELISDFPKGNDAEVISFLQMHPQGLCAMSRNVSNDESSEWTCVHDIQEREYAVGETDPYVDSLSQSSESSVQDRNSTSVGDVGRVANSSNLGRTESEQRNSDESSRSANSSNSCNNRNNNNNRSNGSIEWMQGRVRILVRSNPDSNVPSSEGSIRADSSSIQSHNSPANTILTIDNRMPRTASAAVIAPLRGDSEPLTIFRHSDFSDFSTLNRPIKKNIPRLTHFIEEPNVGKGFIKVSGFSADGRLICSPYGKGVRILAFSPECSIYCPDKAPVPLHELATNICHNDIVVSTKFSPQDCLLVSGCLGGKIVWHQPVV